MKTKHTLLLALCLLLSAALQAQNDTVCLLYTSDAADE